MSIKPQPKAFESILAITVGLLVLYIWKGYSWALYVSVGVALSGLLVPFLRDLIVWSWSKLGQGLGYVNSRILLTLVYVFVLVPIALIRRLFSSDSKIIKKRRSDTYYITRNHTYGAKDLVNPW